MEASPELFASLDTGVRICYQTFGDPSDPATVFIPGHSGSMLEWRDELLPYFSPPHDKRYLIRFDQRDTGLSTEFPVPGDYDLADMVKDVEGLVDHLELPKRGFHLVGVSLGGAIAYMFASRRSDQLRSLTLMYTSPGASAEIPLNEAFQAIDLRMGQDRATFIHNGNALFNAYATQPLDEEEQKENAAHVERVTDRDMKGGTLYSKSMNHGAAAFADRPGIDCLKDIKCPTTVIQAAKDQVFGVAHGEALAAGIVGAQYVLWDDVGHEVPKRVWGRLARVLLDTWQRGDREWKGTTEST
ncbi:hydrolase or acyltransferase of alpha beta superfamily [Purpureocillium lavendulum]|uniref:Hydrolase or acyltransferase of alpha beta superfamily n=1 Tax=Purpureocillium lavendulum TaxID=1247861 RepID=A0AB34FMX3_9HYPO|nr:hydrolase or acyltransferase of alpha beta superfamily [Purpureocillium lavendulum]